jgi:hypothetical protein
MQLPVTDGWYPRWSEDGQYLCFGNELPQIWHRPTNAIITVAASGRMVRWQSFGMLTWVDPIDDYRALRSICAVSSRRQGHLGPILRTDDDPNLVGGNSFDAGGGSWASTLDATRRLALDNAVITGVYAGVSIAVDLVTTRRSGDVPTSFVWIDRGTRWLLAEHPLPAGANAWHAGDQGWVGYGYWWAASVINMTGETRNVTVTPWATESVPIVIEGPADELWVWTTTSQTVDAVEHVWTLGRPLEDSVVGAPCIQVELPVQALAVAWSANEDCWLLAGSGAHGELYVEIVPGDAQRTPVESLEPPEPVPPPVTLPPKVTITSYLPDHGHTPLLVHAIWAAETGSGPIDRVRWRSRLSGTADWHIVATNPASDPDHLYEFAEAGTYEISLEGQGPGGTATTGQQRLVTIEAVQPPQPVPEPPAMQLILPQDAIYFTTADERHWLRIDHDHDGRLGADCVAGEQPPNEDAWERYRLEPLDDGTVAIQSVASGSWPARYLCADQGGGGAVNANREVAGAWEGWRLHDCGNGRVSIETREGGWYLCADQGGGGSVDANRTAVGPWETFQPSVQLFFPAGEVPVTGEIFRRVAGRLRVVGGRLSNDDGYWPWHSLSEFSSIHLARTGQLGELARRFDRARNCRRTCVRVLMMAANLFDLKPSQSGYWEAVATVDEQATARGLYVEWVIFADAQMVMPDQSDRQAFVHAVVDHLGTSPGALFQLANEPTFNGFDGALDPQLLALADQLASRLGHRDFSIGDPPDGDDVDASAETMAETKELARHSTIVVLHSSRKGGAQPADDGRLRRWVDHLEGYIDIIEQCGAVKGGHDEPMGHASQQWVPLPGGKTYERESNAAVALAAAATAHFIGCGYCFHYISEQDDGVPGLDLIGQYIVPIPVDPVWQYYNDSWVGSATAGFTWQGGKCRTWSNGHEAYVLIYGTAKGSITWAAGWAPTGPPLLDLGVADAHGMAYVQLWHCP